MEITRVGIASVGKILGIIYGGMGLLFVPFFLLAFLLDPQMQDSPFGGGGVLAVGVAVAVPLLYAVLGFLSGAFAAWLYNLAAGWVGGIELETRERATAP